jgi:recombinational DNA repair ATPase RecF
MKQLLPWFAALALLGAEAAALAAEQPPPKPAAAKPQDSPKAAAEGERVELDATQITGNRELPRVLYVVPWKRADLGELSGKPARSLLDEVLAPVDRDVFQRQNRYHDALKPDTAATSQSEPKVVPGVEK